VEEKKDQSHKPDQAAKAHLVRLMQMGYPWQKAGITAGLQVSRSTGCVRTQNTESHPMVLGLSADLRCQAIIRVCKASNRWRNSSRWCSNDTDWLMVVRNRKN
jgi:hypothetical protein